MKIREQIHKDFCEYIAEERRKQKLLQTDLADNVGISQPYLSRMENGQREIDIADAVLLCLALGLDLNDFINKYR